MAEEPPAGGATERGRSGLDALVPEIYQELRRLAARAMSGERESHTLQTTALVHEAYLELSRIHELSVESRPRFLALAAEVMRRILVDHARARRAAKRGGGAVRVTLSDSLADPEATHDLVALDEALTRLAEQDAQLVRVVEMRFLAGMSVEETGEALGVSPTTVKRDSAMARAWLLRELTDGRRVGA
ncbi:MAG TPA: ECF-type sigma factor [Thermoanaerobaculia bacterium]|jgi:RNA polymerase sigma factor (TIGR02999 family)